MLQECLDRGFNGSVEPLFALLSDRHVPQDSELPETGMDIERSRRLGSIFVSAGDYGTRCSTVMLLGNNGNYQFHERVYNKNSEIISTVSYIT